MGCRLRATNSSGRGTRRPRYSEEITRPPKRERGRKNEGGGEETAENHLIMLLAGYNTGARNQHLEPPESLPKRAYRLIRGTRSYGQERGERGGGGGGLCARIHPRFIEARRKTGESWVAETETVDEKMM